MESFEKTTFSYQGNNGNISVAAASAPIGWSKKAWKTEANQSWERPFRLDVEMTSRSDGSGPRLTGDTGEAFSYFELANMAATMGFQSSGFGNPMMGMGFGGFGSLFGSDPILSEMSAMTVPKPSTGRPERPFRSLPDYLDSLIVACDNGFLARNQLWLLGETIVGETQDEMFSREMQLAAHEDKLWREAEADIGGGFAMRVNSAIDRTMARHYQIVDVGGMLTHIIVGAKVHGFDKFCFKGGTAPSSMLGVAPFGCASLGQAYYYDVEWIVEKRFWGIMVDGDRDIEWFKDAVIRFGSSLEFDKTLMGQMNKEYKKAADASLTARKKANEEFHQYNQELGKRMEQRDRERQARMKQHEEQLAADRQRRQAQDKKMETDRRVREAWSEAIRGTEKYRDPYGNMVEGRLSGPDQRAFYDHRTGQTFMSDISDYDKPDDWEELDKWDK